VRMFWNANSTLDASKADVSINDNEFSAVTISIRGRKERYMQKPLLPQ